MNFLRDNEVRVRLLVSQQGDQNPIHHVEYMSFQAVLMLQTMYIYIYNFFIVYTKKNPFFTYFSDLINKRYIFKNVSSLLANIFLFLKTKISFIIDFFLISYLMNIL